MENRSFVKNIPVKSYKLANVNENTNAPQVHGVERSERPILSHASREGHVLPMAQQVDCLQLLPCF